MVDEETSHRKDAEDRLKAQLDVIAYWNGLYYPGNMTGNKVEKQMQKLLPKKNL